MLNRDHESYAALKSGDRSQKVEDTKSSIIGGPTILVNGTFTNYFSNLKGSLTCRWLPGRADKQDHVHSSMTRLYLNDPAIIYIP